MPATEIVFRCLMGISEENRRLIQKHKTLDRSAISSKLLEQKVMSTDEILQLIDALIHRAVKNALLKEEQEIRSTERAALAAKGG